jgi:hypothetical protein
MRSMIGTMWLAALALSPDAEAGTANGTTPATPAGVTDEELRALFGPQDLIDRELVEETELAANVEKAKESPHFLKVSRELREVYDRVQTLPKSEVLKEDKLKANAFRMVAMGGPDEAEALVYFVPPKRTAKEAADEIPHWASYVNKEALKRVYPVLMQAFDDLLGPEREATLKACQGLPASVGDHKSFLEQNHRFQVNNVVSDEEFEITEPGPDGKPVKRTAKLSLGYRNDLFRSETKGAKKKAEEAKKAPTGGPAATTEAPAAGA